jgi:hypothetical protein
MHPVVPEAEPSQLLYGWVIHMFSQLLGKSAFAYSFLAVILVYLKALYLNFIAARHRLFLHNTYLPSFVLIVLSALHPAAGQMSAPLLVNFLLLFSINELLCLKQNQNAGKHLFNIGFAVVIGALMQFSVIFLCIFMLISLLILRPFSFREWMILIVGFAMPLYILMVILFCADKWQLMHFWPDLGISLPGQLKPGWFYLGMFGGIIIWICISLYNMQMQLPKAPIYIRRCWISLTLLLFFCLLVAIFSDSRISGAWMICLVPLSLVLTQAFLNERGKRMNLVSFYFVLALLLFCQIFLPI